MTDIELTYCKKHLFMDDKQRNMVKQILNRQKEMLEIYQNEIREIAQNRRSCQAVGKP